ncbi:MAG: metalloregulator ArsR/SmtB family transcription factor [Propionibacteriaceae bacterium]|nr:metalloregulator ArsR/SmtB family transcription factor [Propionibacteriaceae bacterium]
MTIDNEKTVIVDEQATAAYAHLFAALGDPTRLAVLQHLAAGPHRVRDLVEHMGFAQSTVSKHLAFLCECGLVQARPDGRSSWYSLAQPALLGVLIASAEATLQATGSRAVLCAHIRNLAAQTRSTGVGLS